MKHKDIEKNKAQDKQIIIEIAKVFLAQVPFEQLEDCADNLFDLYKTDEAQIEERLSFLRSTKLAEIEYFDTTNGETFVIGRRDSEERIRLSNRNSNSNELRGEALRQLLEQTKKIKAEESLYETITSALRSQVHSDTTGRFRYLATQPINDHQYMTSTHFDLFTAILLGKIRKKIANKILADDLNPKQIRDDEVLREHIWQGINIEAIYDTTMLLMLKLEQCKKQSLKLDKRGYPRALEQAETLFNYVAAQQNALVEGTTSLADFETNCTEQLNKALDGEFKNHRGFFSKGWRSMNSSLHYLLPSVVPIIEGSPTKSVKKTLRVKEALTLMIESTEEQVSTCNPS